MCNLYTICQHSSPNNWDHYGIWNLDFFGLVIPPLCLNISPLQALALDYAIAFYPLLLVVLTYILIILHSRGVHIVVCLWKPFQIIFSSKKRDWNMQGSVVKAFATFFLLSYLKILNVTYDLLVFTDKYTLSLNERSYSTKPALYYDASVEYFKGSHLYYGIAAIFVGIFFVFLPLVFLVIYPMRWFQKCLNFRHIQSVHRHLHQLLPRLLQRWHEWNKGLQMFFSYIFYPPFHNNGLLLAI